MMLWDGELILPTDANFEMIIRSLIARDTIPRF